MQVDLITGLNPDYRETRIDYVSLRHFAGRDLVLVAFVLVVLVDVSRIIRL